jgi:hypothetical protein
MPAFTEPCAKKTLFIAHREAAEVVWGKGGIADIARRLPEAARRAVIEPVVITEPWLPERHIVSWHEAAWEGPCRRDTTELYRYLHAVLDCGFGRIQRLLVTLVTPAALFSRGESLWKNDHSHGDFKATLTGDRAGVIRLRDHPYVTSPFLRRSTAETYRYVGSLTRCRAIRESHTLDPDGTLVVRLDWD